MGENLDADYRLAVRTPMQWNSGRNGGFSSVDPEELDRPVVPGRFGPEHVNVAAQKQDPESLFVFFTFLTHRYRECLELSWGDFEVLNQPVSQVLAHRCTWEGEAVVALHNFGPDPVTVPLRLPDEEPGTELRDLLRSGGCALGEDSSVEVELGGYGFRWLRVRGRKAGGGILPNILTSVDV